jgi:hemerythrin superfamily protein
MADIDSLRLQHEEILALLEELRSYESLGDIIDNAQRLSLIVGRLARKFYLHILAEERVVYPVLLSHEDESIREAGRSFSAEMDEIAAKFRKYRWAYSNAGIIFARPDTFRYNTAMAAKTFSKRFEDEKAVLFRLLDGAK